MKRESPSYGRVIVFRRVVIIASLMLGASPAWTQTGQQRIDDIAGHMQRLQNVSAHIPASLKPTLSAGAQHLLYTAGKWDEIGPQLAKGLAPLNAPLKPLAPPAAPATLPSGEVSDPSQDLKLSRLIGFVQSETSTAWCGHTVVVGYNDSGSFVETLFLPIGLSFNGYARSTDAGLSFTDLGFVNPGANFFAFLQGDPVLVCSDENRFYQASIFSSSFFTTEISVSKSTDGGQTFADPVSVVTKDAFFHFLDKPWMAVDPSNGNRVYVTYTDFDFSGGSCAFIRTGIELVTSSDGGITWSPPTVVFDRCFPDGVQGSNVQVDGAGTVYVAWETFPAATLNNNIEIATSSNHGASFGSKVTVSPVIPVGGVTTGLLQGGFRNNEFPSLAIDPRGPGRLYVAWNDGKKGENFDLVGGLYDFGDAFVSRSADGAAHWSTPVQVNNDTAAVNKGTDHYLPGVAVGRDGSVASCWYDRRRDAQNFLIDRECAASHDGGETWANTRITNRKFSPVIAEDLLINPVYMGDYDTVAADHLGKVQGFLSAYGNNANGNPDVRISRRFGGSDDSGAQDEN